MDADMKGVLWVMGMIIVGFVALPIIAGVVTYAIQRGC